MRASTNLRLLVGAFAALALGAGLPANAGTTTGNIDATMTIADACLSTSGTVSFPEYLPNSPSNVTAAGSGATLQCNVGDAWSITAAAGANSAHKTGTCGAVACQRAMANGANFIGYDLYVGACCAGTTVWNAANKITGTGDGTAQTITFFGLVAKSQNVAAGTYTDTVVATYTF